MSLQSFSELRECWVMRNFYKHSYWSYFESMKGQVFSVTIMCVISSLETFSDILKKKITGKGIGQKKYLVILRLFKTSFQNIEQ